MTKRLCKLNRRDIQEHLGDIHRLVAEPKFVCRSCARSADDQSRLCKPAAIPPLSCQKKAQQEQQSQCGLLQETITQPADIRSEPIVNKVADEKLAQITALPLVKSDSPIEFDSSEQTLKQAKKAIKKQKKHLKAMKKVLKKQRKLAKKHQKLKQKIEQASSVSLSQDASVESLH